jgi:hypothetical protein
VLPAKVAALIGLLAIASWHRRRSLPALRVEQPGTFRRLASAEVLLFATTIGLAVGLARTPIPPPAVDNDALTTTQLDASHHRQELPS